MPNEQIPKCLGLKAGDWVMVRSKEEVLSTLDSNARLEELPFMPQMLSYCGKKLQVRKRAHKVCDTVNETGARELSNSVVLEDLRCDGHTYGGCEMRCSIIWKESWLKRITEDFPTFSDNTSSSTDQGSHANTIEKEHSDRLVWEGTRANGGVTESSEPVYVCQATQLPHATKPLPRWQLRQYIEDYRSGNVRVIDIFSSLSALAFAQIAESGLGFGSALRWAYDLFQKCRGGTPYPFRRGRIPRNSRTPTSNQHIQVGDLVRVKSYNEILGTVDEDLKNRGMSFHAEMATHCGNSFRVSQRLRKLMNEKTGKIMVLKNECLVLEGIECVGMYAKPIYCPRSSYLYWRELWLERIEGNQLRDDNRSKD